MNNYDRMVFDKYAYDKPYIWVIYGEFERRVNATLEEYEGLKTGECRFDYKSWENRLKVTRKNLQTSIKCLSNDKVIKQVVKGKKGHGSSIYFLLRFEDKIRDNFKDSNTNGLQGEEDNKNNMDNKKDNNMDNKKDNYKVSNINVTQDKADNKKDNNMDNKKVNTSIYNNPNIISNNIYSSSKDESDSKGNSEKDNNSNSNTNNKKKKNTKSEDFKFKSKDHEEAFKEIWSLYPNKKGIAKARECINKLLDRISKDELIRCVNRYKAECIKEKREKKYIKRGSTFFSEDYEDYLDCNYEENTSLSVDESVKRSKQVEF